MGWDAFATKDGEGIEWGDSWKKEYPYLTPADPVLRDAFAAANARAVGLAGEEVDWLLKSGALDVSTCGEMMARVGIAAWSDDLAPSDVRRYAKADWGEPPEKNAWAYWSARIFIETCAELGLGVRFSW